MESPTVRVSLAVGVVFFLFLVARWAYLPFLDNDIEGDFFGFRYLSAFLYAMGIECATLCLGLIMYFSTNFMLHGARVVFRSISIVIISISLYFVCWVFFGSLALSLTLEILFSFLTSAALVLEFVRLLGFVGDFTTRHKAIISEMLDDLIESAPRYMNEKEVDRYDEEVVYPRIKKVTDQLNR